MTFTRHLIVVRFLYLDLRYVFLPNTVLVLFQQVVALGHFYAACEKAVFCYTPSHLRSQDSL